MAKYLSEMVLVDIFGEFFDNNLQLISIDSVNERQQVPWSFLEVTDYGYQSGLCCHSCSFPSMGCDFGCAFHRYVWGIYLTSVNDVGSLIVSERWNAVVLSVL